MARRFERRRRVESLQLRFRCPSCGSSDTQALRIAQLAGHVQGALRLSRKGRDLLRLPAEPAIRWWPGPLGFALGLALLLEGSFWAGLALVVLSTVVGAWIALVDHFSLPERRAEWEHRRHRMEVCWICWQCGHEYDPRRFHDPTPTPLPDDSGANPRIPTAELQPNVRRFSR